MSERSDTIDDSKFQPYEGALLVRTDQGMVVPPDAERGGTILDSRHTLLNLEAYKDRLVFLSLSGAIPNPEQPRDFFDEEKMDALRESIGINGQSNPIHVAPVIDRDGQVRFLIIDGERRFRVLTELEVGYIKAIVRWMPTAHHVFEESLVLNVNREDHTPIELAHAYERMLNHYLEVEGGDKKKAMAQVLRRLTGVSENEVVNYMRLLKLSPSTQKVLATISRTTKGAQFTAQAQIQFAKLNEKFGDNMDDLRAARLIITNPDRQFEVAESGPRKGTLSVAGVRAAVQAALMEKGRMSVTEARQMEVASKVNAVLGVMTDLRRTTKHFSDPSMAADAVDILKRKRGHTPAKIHEDIGELLARLQTFHANVVAPALEPEPLEIPKGAPRFAEQVHNIRARFPNKQRLVFAQILAGGSDDNGQVLTAFDIAAEAAAKCITIDPRAVGVLVKWLQEDLQGSKLVVETHQVRRRRSAEVEGQGKRKLVAAWRLAWKSGDGK